MYALGCLALAATVASCGSNANKKAAADSTATAQAQAPAEDEGWTVIFDGKTLDGWRGYDKTGVPAAWTVEDRSSYRLPSIRCSTTRTIPTPSSA